MKNRLFLSIDLPQRFSNKVRDLQEKITKIGPSIAWEDPEKIHLDLNYLGRVDNETTQKVFTKVIKIAKIVPQFKLKISFVETNFLRHEESLIYLSPTGELDTLLEMQKAFAKLFQEISPQPIRFQPQFVIGYLRKIDPVIVKSILGKVDEMEIEPWEEFVVENLSLYKSFSSRAGVNNIKFREFSLVKPEQSDIPQTS